MKIVYLHIKLINLSMTHIRFHERRLFFLVFVLIYHISAMGTPSNIRFRSLQTQNGLSNNDVNCIFKDSHGFIWIGTASGLNRYDGYTVKIFHSQRPDSTALRDNYVQNIQEDSEGNLWICAGDSYSVYHPKNERFSWFSSHKAKELGLPSEPSLIYIEKTSKWFVVENHQLYCRKADNTLILFHDFGISHHIVDMKIHPQSGNLIAIDATGILYVLKPDGELLSQAPIPRTVGKDTSFSLFVDNEDNIWTYSVLGVDVFHLQDMSWQTRFTPYPVKDLPIKAMNQDHIGRIWLGTDNYGIYIIEKDGAFEILKNNPTDIYSLPNNTVKAIYNSSDGGMWIGTYKKGISMYFPSEYKFSNKLIADVNCITRNPNEYSSVWLGTDHSGLMRYNYTTHELVKIADPTDSNCSAITSLTTDSKGNLWIGTYNNGLKKYANGVFSHWNVSDGLASDNIWAIMENEDKTLCIGTLGGGLQIFNPEDNTFKTFNVSNSNLKSDMINTLAKGRDGSIYVGTTYGISCITLSDYSIHSYQGSNKDHRNFTNLNINQVFVDSRGLIWVGTREGLEVYDIKADTLYNVSLSERFPNPFILGVIEGADHSMWVTVGNEIFNISVYTGHPDKPFDFKVKTYGSHEGIVSGTFNQRSMCLLPSGELLVGSLEGIVKVNPEKIILNTIPSRVIFTGVSIKNVPLETGREYNGKVLMPNAPDYTDQIKLKYDQNDLTISFTTDNFCNPERTTYLYKLENFDDDWIACASGMHHATYTNLPPGTYTLWVKAINSDGFESKEANSLSIVITAPWWATWWAKLLYLFLITLSVIGCVAYFHRRSIAQLRQRQKEELDKKTEELNQLKFKFFTNVSHELRTPLTLILAPVESMLKENPEGRNLHRLHTIKTNAHRLLYLVNQLLDFRKNEMAGLTLHLSEGDIITTIRQACNSFNELTEHRDISLNFETPHNRLDMSYDNDKFTKIIVNLLSNAVKYTPKGGNITVKLGIEDTYVRISVADNGRGISDEDKAHIFERFYQGEDKSDLSTGTGIGLSLVYEYTKLHGGSVEVSDNTPKGTLFTVILPFRPCTKDIEALHSSLNTPETDTVPASCPNAEPNDKKNDKPHVLFADDNRDLIEFLKDEFSEIYTITTAFNGIEALEYTKRHTYDLIVTDLMMPEMDGIELTRHLKSDQTTVDTPLIMLTAKQDMGSVIEGLTLGADEYITKPFNNEILALKMHRLIQLKRKGMTRTLIDPTPSKIEITSLDQQLIEKAVKYVEDNIARSDLSVEELAQNMGMSRVHFYKKITMLTGKSPIEFIRLLRLKRATQYLAESQLTIAEIAYQLGFNNPKYFSKYFKEEFGLLPSEYQEQSGIHNKSTPI